MTDDPKQSLVEVQRILEERAHLLARTPQEETRGETVEMVVVALDTERYGIEIGIVSEIQSLGGLTPVPGVQSYWLGLVNLRSHLVPLLDLRAYLGLTPFPISEREHKGENHPKKLAAPTHNKDAQIPEGQIMVVNSPGYPVGLLVDNVIEVRELPRTEIGPPLKKVTAAERKITEGLTSDLLTILDIGKVLTDPRLVVQDETA